MSHPVMIDPRGGEASASDVVDGFSGLRTGTARAFLLAPGIAALVGGMTFLTVAMGMPSTSAESVLIFAAAAVIAAAVVGYSTALVIALPVYLLLPEQGRRSFAVVVPLAGAIAAAPWVALGQPWRGWGADTLFLLIPFALGCVAGIAFWLIRGERPGAAGCAVGGGGS